MRTSSVPSNPAWERLLYVVAETGRLTVASFARSIGLKSACSLYSIRKKGAFGKLQANRINRAYPRFSVAWLMCNDGSLIDREAEPHCVAVNGNPIISIPLYYNLNRYDSRQPLPVDQVIYLSGSLCNGAKFATFYNSDALFPKLPKGALLMLRPCDPSEIIFDCLYYVVTGYSRSYRIVKRGRAKDKVRLTSCRQEFYPDKEIACECIRELYLICAVFNLTYPID